MTARDMLTQAKQGNPQAIAVILNHFTRPKEISTDVSAYEDALRIVFSAHRLPNQSVMMSFVRRSIEQLDIDAVSLVQVVGQRLGDNPAAWVAEIVLHDEEDAPEYLGSFEEDPDSVDEPIEDVDTCSSASIAIAPSASTPEAVQNGATDLGNGHVAYVEVNADQTDGAIQPLEPSQLQEEETLASVNRAWQEAADSPVLRRPEAVVLILFVLVLILWQTYQAIIESAAPEGSLNGRELARRLSVSYSTISRRKNREDFAAWSQALDPDGITWVYTDSVFVPQL